MVDLDLSFSPVEIETMLREYTREKRIEPDIPAIAEKLYYYTSGYPWLVSKLCKFIDENIVSERGEKNWSTHDVETAFTMVEEGYLLIYDFNKNKEYKQEQIVYEDKRIFAIWV